MQIRYAGADSSILNGLVAALAFGLTTLTVFASHAITGNIIDPEQLCSGTGACTAHRIPVCAGTGVSIATTDSSGGATNSNIGKGDIACVGNICSVAAVDVTEKYKSISADGKDTDRMSLLPQP